MENNKSMLTVIKEISQRYNKKFLKIITNNKYYKDSSIMKIL